MSDLRRLPVWLEIICLVPILALAAYLRLGNQPDNPGWYTDEGTHIDIAANLLHGRIQYMAVQHSWLMFGRPPLFPLLLTGFFAVAGEGIGTLRALSGSLGVITVLALYLAARRLNGGMGLAALAAALLAIYPPAVLYSRIGFSYNLLAPLALVVWIMMGEYWNTPRARRVALGALTIGIGAAVDLAMLTFALPFIVLVSARRWKHLLWTLPLLVCPLIIYLAVIGFIAPEAMWFDLRFTLSRLAAVPLIAQPVLAAVNYAVVLGWNYWWAPAMVGLFLLRPPGRQGVTLAMFFLPFLALARTAGFTELSFYYLIPLFPFVALGMAVLLYCGTPLVVQSANKGFTALLNGWGWEAGRAPWWRARLTALTAALTLFITVAAPFVVSAFEEVTAVQRGFRADFTDVLIAPDDARAVAAFVNASAEKDDLIIASPATAWLLRSRVADFQMAVAAEGRATIHLPADIPAERFAYDPRCTGARFVVVDSLWRRWAAPIMPPVAELLARVEEWPLVFRAGEIEVYRNPVIAGSK